MTSVPCFIIALTFVAILTHCVDDVYCIAVEEIVNSSRDILMELCGLGRPYKNLWQSIVTTLASASLPQRTRAYLFFFSHTVGRRGGCGGLRGGPESARGIKDAISMKDGKLLPAGTFFNVAAGREEFFPWLRKLIPHHRLDEAKRVLNVLFPVQEDKDHTIWV